MPKLRKMLGSADSPYILSLMKVIETQSKETLSKWSIAYAEDVIVPLFKKHCENDMRPEMALQAAHDFAAKAIKLPELKKAVADCNISAKELENNPVAQAAARVIGQATAVIYTPTHSLGLAFYASAAIAYDRVGFDQSDEVYDSIAGEVCLDYEERLHKIAVENEPNPAKVNWYC